MPSSTLPLSFLVHLQNLRAPLRNSTADFVVLWQLCWLRQEAGTRAGLVLAPQQQEEMLLLTAYARIYWRVNTQHSIFLPLCHKIRTFTYCSSLWLTCKLECKIKCTVLLLVFCRYMASRDRLLICKLIHTELCTCIEKKSRQNNNPNMRYSNACEIRMPHCTRISIHFNYYSAKWNTIPVWSTCLESFSIVK